MWSNRPPRPPKSDGERFETMVMQHLKMLTAKVGSMDIVLKELYHVLKGSMPEETENKLSDSEDMYEKDGRFVLSGHSLQDLETLKRASVLRLPFYSTGMGLRNLLCKCGCSKQRLEYVSPAFQQLKRLSPLFFFFFFFFFIFFFFYFFFLSKAVYYFHAPPPILVSRDI